MQLSAKLYNHEFIPLAGISTTFEVTSYSWKAIGGPDKCNVTVWGNHHDVWAATEWLRYPIEILDPNGAAVWWGYVKKVTVRLGAVAIVVSLDTLTNKVAVAYTTSGADERSTTAWAEDADSIERYGTREMLLSLGAGDPEIANNLRDTQLEERKLPTPRLDHTPNANALSATLECEGWFQTLDWQYYSNPIGQEAYTFEGLGTQYFADSTSTMQIYQAVQCPSTMVDTWTASTISLKMRKANSPSTPVWVALSTSTWSGLTTGSLAASDVGPNHAWLDFDLSPTVTIQPNTRYLIRVYSSSIPDPNNYYVVNINEELSYGRGEMGILNSASYHAASTICAASADIAANTWLRRCPDADMEFKLAGSEETTRQLLLAASRSGQFFTAIDIEASSSVWSTPYQSGDRTGLSVVETLLESGTANKLRMTATVNINRHLIIKEEQSVGSITEPYILDAEGRLTHHGSLVHFECPAGNWCMLRGIIPADTKLSLVFDPSTFYIERATFTTQNHAVRLESKADAEIFAMVKGG